ncbi:MAG TPA: BamA/TamA family outer membrane protein [Flavitalea sp.]|nr:BamA/TamA family outer membrane protein [Flavitalea sp.]
MAKVNRYYHSAALMLVLLATASWSQAQYSLEIYPADKSFHFIQDTLRLRRQFSGKEACQLYVNGLPALLRNKGYMSASVDSVRYDSVKAFCELYIGETYTSAVINTDSIDRSLLQRVGWPVRSAKPITMDQFSIYQQKLLDQLENMGYPFAALLTDSVSFRNNSMHAVLNIEKGPLYKIDSIRNYGKGSISSSFLQQYLGIPNGSIYSKEKLGSVSNRLRELPFLQEKQPWDMTLLGTGSVLNLYLDPRKSSEVNVLIGLLPANNQLEGNKLLVTGEATINLKNSLGSGETIGLDWQQLQVKSPRLNLLYQQPYLFGSPFGTNFNFDLFKKDSSFINISILLGVSYAVSARQTGTVFIQRLTTNLLTVDTQNVKNSKRLPPEADLNSTNLGVSYEWITTDYRFNPRRGNEFSISGSVGTKNIRKNNAIVKLQDLSDPSFDYASLYDTFQLKSYQFRLKLNAAHYFPLTRGSTIKTSLSGGWFQSPDIFRNELFQIGGYKLLRGFDEESIFSSQFGVASVEYRYLLGLNSFFSVFADYGLSSNRSLPAGGTQHFLGAGLGMSFETKAGIFNISYAAGKRDEDKFNLRQSKIHLGYVNFF